MKIGFTKKMQGGGSVEKYSCSDRAQKYIESYVQVLLKNLKCWRSQFSEITWRILRILIWKTWFQQYVATPQFAITKIELLKSHLRIDISTTGDGN